MLLRGSESVLVQRAQDRLLAQARAKDPNVEVSRLEAAGYDKGQLAGLVSPSLFGEPRLIIINDLEHATDALIEDLLNYLQAPEEDVNLVLRHASGNRGKKLLDAIAKAGMPVVECAQIKSARDKSSLVIGDVRRAKRQIDPDAVEALVEALGSDLTDLLGAVKQLLADTSGTITLTQVNIYYGGRIEASGLRLRMRQSVATAPRQ